MKQKGISSIVIILIIVGILVMAGGIWYFYQKPTAPRFADDYYNDLYKRCSDGCCKESVERMAAGNFKLPETDKDCPTNFQPNMLKCITSYKWCEPKTDETAQWKVYTNTEYKYRVSYPSNWELGQITVKQSPAAVRFTKITKQGDKYLNDAVVDIIVEPNPLRKTPTEEWYREWVKQIPAGINLKGVKIEETTFKNMKALKIDNSTIFFAKGFNMFRIEWHVAGDYDQSLVESTEKIFEQMSDTFAFFD